MIFKREKKVYKGPDSMTIANAKKRRERAPLLELPESSIQRTICDFLRAEQWRVFEFERTWSELKRKAVGEEHMPDVLAIRYDFYAPTAQVLWLECKRIYRGKPTQPTQGQRDWKRDEKARGAMVWTLGEDCGATIECFLAHYKASGLQRRAQR